MKNDIKNSTEIKDFLKDNRDSLLAISILGTLIALLADLSIGWISYFLSFLMTMSLIFVWSEIKFGTFNKDGLKLFFLKWCFKFSFWFLILYILLKYRILSWWFLFFPIAFLLLYWFGLLFKKFNWFSDSLNSNRLVKRMPVLITILVLTITSIYLARFVSIPINNTLDQVDHWNYRIHLY